MGVEYSASESARSMINCIRREPSCIGMSVREWKRVSLPKHERIWDFWRGITWMCCRNKPRMKRKRKMRRNRISETGNRGITVDLSWCIICGIDLDLNPVSHSNCIRWRSAVRSFPLCAPVHCCLKYLKYTMEDMKDLFQSGCYCQ